MSDFGAEFAQAWAKLAGRFLKLECWQTYQEQPSNRSLDAYIAGDVEAATRLLRKEAEGDRPLYDDIMSRNLDYARTRLIRLPLTPYLEYELVNFEIRAAMGENIVVVLPDPSVSLPNDDFFDFLLFDDTCALVHDYGMDGFQVGGWLVVEPAAVRRLEDIVVNLRNKAISLAEFVRTANV